jgi:hypothetical protein
LVAVIHLLVDAWLVRIVPSEVLAAFIVLWLVGTVLKLELVYFFKHFVFSFFNSLVVVLPPNIVQVYLAPADAAH